jgi:hypothetical protein
MSGRLDRMCAVHDATRVTLYDKFLIFFVTLLTLSSLPTLRCDVFITTTLATTYLHSCYRY